MKKTLFASLLALCCASAAMATTFTTENGYFKWTYDDETEAWVQSASGIGNGVYTGFDFTLEEASLDAAIGTSGTLTTATDNENAFTTGTVVSLDSIMLAGDANGTTVSDDITITITNAAGETVAVSTGVTSAYITTLDPWYDGAAADTGMKYSVTCFTFTFADDVELTVGEAYTATLSESVRLKSTQNGADNWDTTTESGWGLAGATITTSSIVPEPTTATLSLVALAGLMVRRRRQA